MLLVAALLGAGFFWREQYVDLLPSAIAASVGVLIAFALRLIESYKEPSAATAIAVAATLSGLMQWVDPVYVDAAALSLVVGLAFGGWLSGDVREGFASMPLASAAYTAILVAANFMGAKALNNEPGGLTGTLFGLAAAIAALVALISNRSEKAGAAKLKATPGFIAIVVLLILGYVVGGRLVEDQNAWIIFDGAVLAAVIVHWLVRPDIRDDSFSVLLSCVIWIGSATLAFSYLRGYGMAIAAAGAVLALLTLGNFRALLTTGPLIGLTFYRVLRESNLDAVRALDIGQHYAVIGVAFGIVAALLPAEWAHRRNSSGARSAMGRLLWAFALGAAPVAMSVVLGAKGIVGFVAGLGFAAMVEALRNRSSVLPIVFTGGLASVVCVAYPWLETLLDLTREDKQVAFYWIGGATLALALLIALVSKPDVAPEVEVS